MGGTVGRIKGDLRGSWELPYFLPLFGLNQSVILGYIIVSFFSVVFNSVLSVPIGADREAENLKRFVFGAMERNLYFAF